MSDENSNGDSSDDFNDEDLQKITDEIVREEQEDEEANEGGMGESEADNWVAVALERLEDIKELVQTYQEEKRKSEARGYEHRETIIKVAAATLVVLIVGSGIMTVMGALSGDAFTFVLGTLFGSLLTFLQNMLGEEAPQ